MVWTTLGRIGGGCQAARFVLVSRAAPAATSAVISTAMPQPGSAGTTCGAAMRMSSMAKSFPGTLLSVWRSKIWNVALVFEPEFQVAAYCCHDPDDEAGARRSVPSDEPLAVKSSVVAGPELQQAARAHAENV